MKFKHIVLRGNLSMTTNGGIGPLKVIAGTPVRVDMEALDAGEAAALSRERDVVAVAPSMPMRLIAPVSVRAALAAAAEPTWGVRAVRALESPFTGAGVTVAVLDTGIDPAHPAFAGVDLVRRNFTGEGDDDLHGHGTHCAGTIFGRDVDGIRIGVARGVQRAVIGKVLGGGGGSSDTIVEAIQWAADEGAHVISMSLGMDFPGWVASMIEQDGLPPELATSRALEGYRANVQLFERLAAWLQVRAPATLLVAAAGNESRRDQDPRFQIAVAPPAVSNGILSVAALGKGAAGLAIAPFSNTGARVAAPGVDVLSAQAGGGLVEMSGTSMATPHVAGVAALWAERIRATGPLTGAQLAARIEGHGNFEGMAAGFEATDVGAGLVLAPSN